VDRENVKLLKDDREICFVFSSGESSFISKVFLYPFYLDLASMAYKVEWYKIKNAEFGKQFGLIL